MLAVDWVQPGLYLATIVLVALMAKFLPWVTRSAIEDIIARHIQPMTTRLAEHLAEEEREFREIHRHLDKIADNKEQDHRRIWTAIDEMRRR